MSNTLKNRFLVSLGIVVCSVFILYFICKVQLHREDWLSYTIAWSIFVAIGYFISQSIETLEQKQWKKFVECLAIIVVSYLVVVFIIGVLVKLSNWELIIGKTVLPMNASIFVYSYINLIKQRIRN